MLRKLKFESFWPRLPQSIIVSICASLALNGQGSNISTALSSRSYTSAGSGVRVEAVDAVLSFQSQEGAKTLGVEVLCFGSTLEPWLDSSCCLSGGNASCCSDSHVCLNG